MYGPTKITTHAASATVKAFGGFVHGIWISTSALDPAVCRLRDGGASGAIIAEIDLVGAVASPAFHGALSVPMQFKNDIYVEVGANAVVQVQWE